MNAFRFDSGSRSSNWKCNEMRKPISCRWMATRLFFAPWSQSRFICIKRSVWYHLSHYTFLPFGKNPSPPKSDKSARHTHSARGNLRAAPPILYERVRRRWKPSIIYNKWLIKDCCGDINFRLPLVCFPCAAQSPSLFSLARLATNIIIYTWKRRRCESDNSALD